MRDILQSFINADYRTSLQLLNEETAQLRYDMFLGEHIDFIVHEIRRKAILDFTSTFERVDIDFISKQLDIGVHETGRLPNSVDQLQSSSVYNCRMGRSLIENKVMINEIVLMDYLVDLIASKRMPARIDYMSNELVMKKEGTRVEERNLKQVAKMIDNAKLANQLVVFSAMKALDDITI